MIFYTQHSILELQKIDTLVEIPSIIAVALCLIIIITITTIRRANYLNYALIILQVTDQIDLYLV